MSHAGLHAGDGLAPRLVKGYDGTITPPPAAADHGEGPVMTDHAYQGYLDTLAAHPLLRDENVRLPDASADAAGRLLLVVGLIGLGLSVLGVFIHGLPHALAAYEVGVFTVLACCLGSMFLVMVFNMMNAHWAVTIRRQLENVMSLVWLPLLMLVPALIIELAGSGVLMTWLDPAKGSVLLDHKAGFLNPTFLVLRFGLYALVWLGLSTVLARSSREQDDTGDRWATRRMRQLSGVGLLLFALTVPFAAFDFLMALDYRFYSTMFGVYYFAGAIMSAAALTALILAVLRTFGRLTGVVTKEHFHDLGKLLFAFTVFWAYISFSQYFLIWYGNIPEESNWFIRRSTGPWTPLAVALVLGHFVVPFFVLISRKTKKNTLGLGLMASVMLLTQVLDMVFVIRPMVYIAERADANPGATGWWLDVVAVVGVAGVFAALLVRRIASAPLIPMRDPRLARSLAHKNYV